MARRYPVPTSAIEREISKAQEKLRELRKKAPPAKQREIDLEIKVLRCCEKALNDILFC